LVLFRKLIYIVCILNPTDNYGVGVDG